MQKKENHGLSDKISMVKTNRFLMEYIKCGDKIQ